MTYVLLFFGAVFLLAVIFLGYRDDYKRNPKKFIRTFATIFVIIVALYSVFWFSIDWFN